MMALVNDFYKANSITKDEYATLILLLNPRQFFGIVFNLSVIHWRQNIIEHIRLRWVEH